MKKVKIGFVGCGFMGQMAHLPNFAQDQRCEIVALADVRTNLARMVADKYSVPRVYSDHLKLIEDPEVDAIVEVTPDDWHAQIALDALRAGKHVYTEKPMATTSRDAREMVRAANRHGGKLMVSYMKRFDPGVELAKRMLAEALLNGSLGSLTFARSHCFAGDWICNVGRPLHSDEAGPEPRQVNPAWLPQDLIGEYRRYLNVFCHNINLLRHLLGNPREAKFSSFHPKTKILLMEYPDYAAVVEAGSLSARAWDEVTEIYTTDGKMTISTPPPLLKNVPAKVQLYRAGSRQTIETPLPPWDWSFRRCAGHFIECILEDKTPLSSGEDSAIDIELVEDAFKKLTRVEYDHRL